MEGNYLGGGSFDCLVSIIRSQLGWHRNFDLEESNNKSD